MNPGYKNFEIYGQHINDGGKRRILNDGNFLREEKSQESNIQMNRGSYSFNILSLDRRTPAVTGPEPLPQPINPSTLSQSRRRRSSLLPPKEVSLGEKPWETNYINGNNRKIAKVAKSKILDSAKSITQPAPDQTPLPKEEIRVPIPNKESKNVNINKIPEINKIPVMNNRSSDNSMLLIGGVIILAAVIIANK